MSSILRLIIRFVFWHFKQFASIYHYLLFIQCLLFIDPNHHHHNVTASMRNIDQSTSINDLSFNCSSPSMNDTTCSKDLKLICDVQSGRCQCPSTMPVRLSPEIPCLPYKFLGDLCIHSDECGQIENSVCVATFLFSIKILNKTPSFKQWFFYNKIHNDDDMNYLLNKLYGRCRCQKGFRAANRSQCIPSTFDTPVVCDNQRDCASIPNAYCNRERCRCPHGYYYDSSDKHRCNEIINLYGEFCASSSDCFIQQSNMECKNSRCICSRQYSYHNETGCVRNYNICDNESTTNIGVRNQKRQSNLCQQQTSPLSTINICRFVVKSFPLILIAIIISNLFCYIRTRKSSSSLSHRLFRHQREIHEIRRRFSEQEQHRRQINSNNNHHLSSIDQNDQRIQSCSLLSLPDYETVFSDNNQTMPVITCQNHNQHHHPQERLPTYEEAIVLSLKNSITDGHTDDDDDNVSHQQLV